MQRYQQLNAQNAISYQLTNTPFVSALTSTSAGSVQSLHHNICFVFHHLFSLIKTTKYNFCFSNSSLYIYFVRQIHGL